MRIIKLSPKDVSFPERSSADRYFDFDLPNRKPPGMFLSYPGQNRERWNNAQGVNCFYYCFLKLLRAKEKKMEERLISSQISPNWILQHPQCNQGIKQSVKVV